MDISKLIDYSNTLAKTAVDSFNDLPDPSTVEVPELPKYEEVIFKAKTLAEYNMNTETTPDGKPVYDMGNVMANPINTDFRKIVADSVAEQESKSSGGYQAVNTATQALGKYQILESNLNPNIPNNWAKEALGRNVTRQEFLDSPEIQDKIYQYKYMSYYDEAKNKGLNDNDAIRFASASWYSSKNNNRIKDGQYVDLDTDFNKQAGNAPSIKEYSLSILQKVNSKLAKPAIPQLRYTPQDSKDALAYINDNSTKDLLDLHYQMEKQGGVDVDNYGFNGIKNQCVDYVRYYSSKIGKPIGTGSWTASGYTTTESGKNDMMTHWNLVNDFKQIKAGDIFTQSPAQAGSDAGHIGIALTNPDKDGNFYVSHQNAKGFEGKVSTARYNIKALNGVWSPR
jgi:CHAP domain